MVLLCQSLRGGASADDEYIQTAIVLLSPSANVGPESPARLAMRAGEEQAYCLPMLAEQMQRAFLSGYVEKSELRSLRSNRPARAGFEDPLQFWI
jgi:hypothetical protein